MNGEKMAAMIARSEAMKEVAQTNASLPCSHSSSNLQRCGPGSRAAYREGAQVWYLEKTLVEAYT
jgi:hypothetical protein